jgi:hypothetical protein
MRSAYPVKKILFIVLAPDGFIAHILQQIIFLEATGLKPTELNIGIQPAMFKCQ